MNRLLQSSQQAKAEGKDKSSFPFWLVALVLVVLFVIVAIIIIVIIAVMMMRRRGKKKSAAASSTPSGNKPREKPAPAYSPTPTPGYSASPAAAKPSSSLKPPTPAPAAYSPGDQGMTIDLSRTVAITPETDTEPINYGSIKFISGALAGKEFEIKPDGEFVGRDGASAQVVIPDPRISKRHLWIGVREGRVVILESRVSQRYVR